MDSGKKLCGNMSNSSSLVNEFPEKGPLNRQPFTNYGTQQDQMKWEDSCSLLDYGIGSKTSYSGYSQLLEQPKSSIPCESSSRIKTSGDADGKMEAIFQATRNQDWDPKAMLSNLFFLEQKIHQLQDLVHLIVGERSQVVSWPDDFLVQQQQLVTADLTSVIVQLISTASSLLPSVKHNFSDVSPSTPQLGQLGKPMFPPREGSSACVLPQIKDCGKVFDHSNDPVANVHRTEQISAIEEHDVKDEDDADEKEHLPPGSYEILQLEKEEILAPHTHFCTICGKGFKRDANLRMHMRGHGDEYKSAAALAKPNKEPSTETMLIKRYSCPYAGCKRNKDHKKFQPLKTILCVKNHYKRSHCDKSFMCSRCNTKKFSVIADLKTHEKHCGRDKWLCSCGTTFSRKDKLFGHIALFQGHTPAITSDEKGTVGPSDRGENKVANSMAFSGGNHDGSTGSGIGDLMDFKANIDDPTACFSPLNFDNLSSSQEFPQPPYQDSDSAFSFLMSCIQKTGENLGPNGL